MNDWIALILAAGKGKRMKSKRPKVLHEICGQPMAALAAGAARAAGIDRTAIVVGHEGYLVKAAMGEGYTYIEQQEQLGTGHAVLQARSSLEGRAAHLLVMNGDVPLVQPGTLRRLMDVHARASAAVTLLVCDSIPTDGLGRIKRDDSGRVCGIVEHADATEEERRIKEVNAGIYCFDAAWLWPALASVKPSKGGEVYLTDLVGLARAAGRPVESVTTSDPWEAMGVDTRVRLAEAEAHVRATILRRWMLDGVTIIDPATTYVDARATIGQDTVLHPNTTITGPTVIGADCAIGPSTILANASIGRACRVVASVIEDSTLEDEVEVGPFSHLRGNTYIESGVHIGNYVEIKKSRLGTGSKSGHFSYLGDATIGRNVNVGAGTITCNFDGRQKLPTVIEDGVFLGCDTMLVAPVTVRAGAKTGAGAVVVRDVTAGTVVVGVPARPLAKDSAERPG